MRIAEKKLRRVIRQVIKESVDIQSKKNSMIERYKNDAFHWNRFARNDFYSMSEGSDGYGVRSEYYPGWSDQDFIDVIIAVDGEYEP